MTTLRTKVVHEQAAWYGPELLSDKSWIYELSSNDISELCSAVSRTKDIPILNIKKSDFFLSRLSHKLISIAKSVDNGLGVALIRGFPINQLSEENTVRALWGMGQHVGVPIPQDASKELVHHVRDTGGDIQLDSNLRIYQTRGAQSFHNDGGDLVMLLCRQAARVGGSSRMVSAITIFNEVIKSEPRMAEVLQKPFYFDARGQQLSGYPAIQKVPIFVWHAGRLNVLHKRPYIDLAQRFNDVPKMSELQIEALSLIDDLCNDRQIQITFDMEPGDIQVACNFSILHARDAFKDYYDRRRKRHMLRLWLGLKDGRRLPKVYMGTREFGPLFNIPGRFKG